MRNRHADADFTFAIKRQIHDIVYLFGSDNVFVLSVDDKAKVPVGVTAVRKQAPLIMHVSYKIRLLDHDFVNATKHKLTPFLYSACEIKPPSSRADPEIAYSGPTYMVIRSGKHDSSTACTHDRDFDHLLRLKSSIKLLNMKMLFNLLAGFFCDGGPDENPRFQKIFDVAIQHFKKYNLDALLISTHVPGLSAYNQVARGIAPLSKARPRIWLPHERFRTHLDSSKKSTHTNLEKRNFKAAGEILAKAWEEVVLDNFPVEDDYVENTAKDPVDLNGK